VQKSGHCRRARLAESFAIAQIAVEGENDVPLFAILGERALRGAMSQLIQSGINSGCDEKETDNEEYGGFKESFHLRGPY